MQFLLFVAGAYGRCSFKTEQKLRSGGMKMGRVVSRSEEFYMDGNTRFELYLLFNC